MPAGIVVVIVRDSSGAPRKFRMWSDDGTLDGNLSAIHMIDPVQSAPKARVSLGGVIAAANVAQTFHDVDWASDFVEIGNPQDAPASLWISDAADDNGVHVVATAAAPSFELLPGQFYTWPKGIAGRVSILSTVLAHAFTGRKA